MTLRSIKKQRPQPFPCPDCGKGMHLLSVSKVSATYFCKACDEKKEVDTSEMFKD